MDNFPGKRRRTKEKVPILLEPQLFQTFSCSSEQSRDIQEVLSLIQQCKTMYCCRMISPSTSTTSGTLTTLHSIIQGGLIPGGRSLKKDRQSVFFTAVNPMYARERSGRSPIRSGQTQNRGVQKCVGESPKYSILVQSEARSKKRIAVQSNSITCNHSFRHTTCDLY